MLRPGHATYGIFKLGLRHLKQRAGRGRHEIRFSWYVWCSSNTFFTAKIYILNVKRKKYILKKTVNRVCVKRCQIYIYWVKKKLVWVFLDRGEQVDANETGLKKGGGIEMSTTVLSIYAIARSPSLCIYLPKILSRG